MSPYKWIINIGALMIRPDAYDPTARKVINYYWHGRYIFTSASWYIVLQVKSRRIIIGFYQGKIVHKVLFHAAS